MTGHAVIHADMMVLPVGMDPLEHRDDICRFYSFSAYEEAVQAAKDAVNYYPINGKTWPQ